MAIEALASAVPPTDKDAQKIDMEDQSS